MKTPIRVEPFSASEILLAWTDGQAFAIPYVELRFLCPCASCVDEHSGQRTIRRESIAPGIRTTSVQTVGRYALQISFSDGHSTGIFPYEKLLQICEKMGRLIHA